MKAGRAPIRGWLHDLMLDRYFAHIKMDPWEILGLKFKQSKVAKLDKNATFMVAELQLEPIWHVLGNLPVIDSSAVIFCN